MNLLEVTLAIGISLALAAAAITQISMQTATIMYYKDVDYYSREVPRTVGALQNLARGAHTFRIGGVNTVTAGDATPGAPLRPPDPTSVPEFRPPVQAAGQPLRPRGLASNGDGLYISGNFSGTNTKEAIVWLADNSGRFRPEGGNAIADQFTQERTFPENNRDICISVRTNGGRWPDGWILNKNVRDMRFDIIPDSGGAVLMTVWKRMRGEAGANIAYQLVLERR